MINKVILLGNVGKDPESKEVNGQDLTKFTLATTESYKKGDEWVNTTEWHNIEAWSYAAKQAARLSKGTQVYIEGKIKTDSWEDKDGNKRQTKKIVATVIRAVGKKESSSAQSAPAASGSELNDLVE